MLLLLFFIVYVQTYIEAFCHTTTNRQFMIIYLFVKHTYRVKINQTVCIEKKQCKWPGFSRTKMGIQTVITSSSSIEVVFFKSIENGLYFYWPPPTQVYNLREKDDKTIPIQDAMVFKI